MRAGAALAATCALAVAGLSVRAAPPVDAGPRRPVPADFGTTSGDLAGRLVRVPGCDRPLGVLVVPGSLSGVGYAELGWDRGPSVAAFRYAGRPVGAGGARLAAVAGRAGTLALRSVGLRAPWPDHAVAALAPPDCAGALGAALDDAGAG